MKTIVKINTFPLQLLNNAEFTRFSELVADLILRATPAGLGIDEADLSAFRMNIMTMTDLVNQRRASAETAKMIELDKRRDDQVTYILQSIRIQQLAPADEVRDAADYLYAETKSYAGIQRIANEQETQKIRGLLMDLGKERAAEAVTKLGLDDAVALLKETNDAYAALVTERAESQLSNTVDPSERIRVEMVEQYDALTTVAFAQSIVAPTDVTAAFIASLNKLIADTKAAYNLRKAIAAAAKKKEKENLE